MPKILTCEETRQLVALYYNEMLDSIQQRRVEAHDKECLSCREYDVDLLVQRLKVLGREAIEYPWGPVHPCPECLAQDTIEEYRENQLTPDERSIVEAHLASCVDCRTEAEAVVPARVLSGVVEEIKGVIKRLRVGQWKAPEVAMATPVRSRGYVRNLVVELEDLSLLRVQPYLRISVRKEESRYIVNFMLERPRDPNYPGCYLEPKRGTVWVQLIRPTLKGIITRRLGSRSDGTFIDSAKVVLRDYEEGEERQWEAEVSVYPGTMWEQS